MGPTAPVRACFVALLLAIALAGATRADGIKVRVFNIQASGLSTYDCSAQVEVHNEIGLALQGFAANLIFFDVNGAAIAHKPFEMTRIRPGARRREGLGFKFARPVDSAKPRDMSELVDQCDVLAAAEVSLRACEADHGSIFSRCQAGLAEQTGSQIPLTIRRDAVAETVDYGVVALPQGHRVGETEQSRIDLLGLTVSTITDELAWEQGLSPTAQGLAVVAVAPRGPAEAAGLRVGDVIAEIDQDETLTSDAARSILENAVAEGRRSALLLLTRNGDPVFAVVRLTH